MPQEEFTSKFKVDISDLKRNISEANHQIKLANAEFDAASAGMDDWSKSTDGVSKKLESLDKVLAAQKSILDSTRAQLERQKEAYAENGARAEQLKEKLRQLAEDGISKNSKEYKQYEQALRDVEAEQERNGKSINKLELDVLKQEAAVGKTEKAVRTYNAQLEDLSDTTKDTADNAEDLEKAFNDTDEDLEDLKKKAAEARKSLQDFAEKGAAKVEKALAALGFAVVGAISGLSKLVIDSASAADELGDMSKKTGLSVEQLQKYGYTAEAVGTNLETITGAQTKLVKSMQSAAKGTGETSAAFKSLNVNVKNTDGSMRDVDDVFMDVIDSLGDIENETERDAMAMQIFGKSARELNPLIREGSRALKQYGAEAESLGAIVSDDVVETLAGVEDELKKVRAQFDATKQNIAAKFAPVVKKVLEAIQKVMVRVNDIVQDPRIQTAIDRLVEAFGKFTDKALNRLIDALPSLINAISFLIENFDTLAISLSALWAVFKGSSVISGAVQAIKSITTAVGAASAATAGWVAGIGIVVAAIAMIGKAVADNKKHFEELTAESTRIKNAVRDAGEAMEAAAASYETTIRKTDLAADKAQEYLDRLEQLEKQGRLTADEQKEYNDLVQKLKSVMPNLNTEIDRQTGFLKEGAKALKDQIVQWREKIKLEAIENRLKTVYEEQLNLQIAMTEAQENYNKELEKANSLTIGLMQGGGASNAYYEAQTAAHAAAEALDEATAAYQANVEEGERLIAMYDDQLAVTGDVVSATDNATGSLNDLTDAMAETGAEADRLAEEHFQRVVGAAQDMFNQIDTSTEESMQHIIETLQHNAEALVQYQENLRTIQERGASENVLSYLESLGVEQAGVIDLIAHATDEEFNNFTSQFDKNTSLAKQAGKEWGAAVANGIRDGMDDKIAEIKKAGKRAAQALAEAFTNVLQIASPSKLFRKYGIFTGEGFIKGWDAIEPKMSTATAKAAKQISASFRYNLGKLLPDNAVDIAAKKQWLTGNYDDISRSVNMNHQAIYAQNVGTRNAGVKSVSFTQNNYSPKALTRREIYLQTKNLFTYSEVIPGV